MDDVSKTPRLDDVPAIGFTFSHQLSVDQHTGEARSIVFQGFVPADATSDTVNSLLDKVLKASARQQALARLPEVRKRYLSEKRIYVNAVEDIVRLDAEAGEADKLLEQQLAAEQLRTGKRGPMRLSAQQIAAKSKRETDRGMAETTQARRKDVLKAFEDEIEELERLIAAAD